MVAIFCMLASTAGPSFRLEKRSLEGTGLHAPLMTVGTVVGDERQGHEGDGGSQPSGPIILTARALETVVSSRLSFGISAYVADTVNTTRRPECIGCLSRS